MEFAGVSGRRTLIGAIVFFILIKAVWAIAPAYLMGSPRLGDDALVYLWASDGSILTSKADTPAVQSIRDLASIPAVDPGVQFQRDRVGLRITGVSASPYYIFGGALLHAGLSASMTFAVMECFTAAVLAFGAASFLSAVFSHRAAGLALIVLALAILPRQGLHFLIPSVLTLGLALLSLGIVLREPAKWRLGALALLVGVSVSLHTIGKAYALLLLSAAVLCPSFQHRKIVLNLKLLTAIMSGVGLGIAIEHLPGTVAAQTGVLPAVDFTAIGANISAFVEDLQKLSLSQPVLVGLCGSGFVFCLTRKNISVRQLSILILFTAAFTSASMIVLPGYPGELMARLSIPLIILSAGFAGQMLTQVFTQRPPFALASAMLVAVTQMPVFVTEFFQNLNGRWRLYDDALLASEVSQLAPGEPVVWLDADNALPAALIRGAYGHPALPFLALGSDDALERLGVGQRLVFAAQPPERLNSLSIFKDTSLRTRFYGWSFADISRISFISRDAPIDKLYVRLSAPSADLSVSAQDTLGGECTGSIEPQNTAGWARIQLRNCRNITDIDLISSCSTSCNDTRVIGFSINAPPRDDINWPWAQGDILAVAIPRETKTEAQAVSFSLNSLLTANQAQALENSLAEAKLLRDRSGVVWFSAKTIPARPSAQ